MLTDLPKPNGPASVTSSRPGIDMIPLGRALRLLASADDFDAEQSPIDAFLRANERYADAARLAKLSSPHALKAWAAERLPALKIPYAFANRIPNEAAQQNLDAHASLKIVQFADDLTMIARWFRDLEGLTIDASPDPHGLAFVFTLRGKPLDNRSKELESKSIHELLRTTSRENCLKSKVTAGLNQIEARSVVLRKRVRLGFSPLL